VRRTLILALVLIVAVPLGLLAWLGARALRDDRSRIEWGLRELAEARLANADSLVMRLFEEEARRLADVTDIDTYEAEDLRERVRTTPEIEALFVQAADGPLVFPPLGGDLGTDEADFLLRARKIFEQRLLLAAGVDEEADRRTGQRGKPAGKGAGVRPSSGWFPWYWDSGLHVIYWRRDRLGNVVGVELNRMRLLADIVAHLPPLAGVDWSMGPGERILLQDSNGREVYSWGNGAPDPDRMVVVRRSLGAPLGSWVLVHQRPRVHRTADVVLRISGLVAVGLSMAALAVFFYRESNRDLREARQRVRFVSRVSHELRTPLTNIRLYAELLEDRLDDDDRQSRENARIIVSESERLSRLIDNVLAFARHGRGELRVTRSAGAVDGVVAGVVDRHRPALARRGVEVEVSLGAPEPTLFDPDAVDQILGNLLANVEKYAADGGAVRVESFHRGACTVVRIADSGPGIPESERERVFEPFVRLHDRLNEGVSGAGIGLTIARDLARLQGGELRLVPSETGACVELELELAAGASAKGGRRP